VNRSGGEVIYLDHNSTTPLLPAVAEAMRPFGSETFGNPASAHQVGRRARQAAEQARETIAGLLDAGAAEVLFTSGATEANNLALFGLAGQPPARILTSPIEHPSVAQPLAQLQKHGFAVEKLQVDAEGVVRASSLEALRNEPVRLVTVMLANNETGAIQPVAELVRWLDHSPLATFHPPAFHCDGVQAVGKVPVSFRQLGVTTLSLSGHKFNGPRGIGALLMKKGTALRPLLWGGHQQHGLRPGTEPVALAVGLAKALELAHHEMTTRSATVSALRQRFLGLLGKHCQPIVLNGPARSSLLNTVNVSFPGCDAATLLMKLDLAGVACSTGSACSSGSLLPSPVLEAMGCPPAVLRSAMRFSLSHLQTEAEIDEAAKRIAEAVRQLRTAAV
jgi:cysteine desulfurase